MAFFWPTTSPSLSLVTPMQTTSRRRDAYANILSVVANSSISGCVESVKPNCLSLGSGLSDQELADYELSDNENERTDSDSSIDNNLDHLCTAKSTELKMKDKIPEFEYIIKTDHASWLDSCKSIQRISAYETLSLMLLFLSSVMKFLSWVVV